MNFNKHYNLEGQHALLGASKYTWINYDSEKLEAWYRSQLAAQRGTETHAFAAACIHRGQRLPKTQKTLNMYVNDSIANRMVPEQILYFSENCFGTADAISFRNNTLRIHDLKTGVGPVHMEQLEIYEALFCLEYKVKPTDIQSELRIYQNDDVQVLEPDADTIFGIMDKIRLFDRMITKLREVEENGYGYR